MEFNFNTNDKEKVWKSESKDIIIEKPIFKEDEVKNKELSDILKILINKEKLGEFIKDNYEFKDILKDKDIMNISLDFEGIDNDIENLDSEKLDELREKYPKLDNMLSSIEDKLQEVEQAKEEDKESLLKSAEQKIKMFKGYVAEALLKENLKDCFEEISEKEVQQETSQGKTNIDITCREAKEDFKIENVEVKKGEDLFIESKIGDKAYITQQIDHMKKQVEGHHNEGNESKNGYKSIIVVSADYKNINDEKRAEFEKHLKEVGTELVVLDKMASEIDDKVRESI